MSNSAGKKTHTQKHTMSDVHWHFNNNIHTAVMLWGIQPGIDATCSLSAHSRFKQCPQICEPPHSSNRTLRLCYSVIMVSKHTLTSCSAHFKLTNGWPISCTAGLHPPQNTQTNFEHPPTRRPTHPHTHTTKYTLTWVFQRHCDQYDQFFFSFSMYKYVKLVEK